MNKQLDISLIHRVLLTNPSDYGKLTVNGKPRPSTMSFADFVQEVNESISMEATIKRAYRDSVAERRDALLQLLLELHEQIRLLVPNRSDLHTLLSDDVTDDITTCAKKAAMALHQLESPDRSESTVEWWNAISDDSDNCMIANSLLYLLYKTELCQQDKEDFYLQHIHSKQITVEVERKWHLSAYGMDLPLTRRWIQSMLNSSQYDSTVSPRTVINMAWIDTILFRHDDILELPEVWALDLSTIQIIRETAKTAAVGFALALLCSHVAVTSPKELEEEPCSDVSLRRDDLYRILSQRHVCCSKDEFEKKVSNAMVGLTTTIAKTSLSPSAIEVLVHRSKSILMAQDPVLAIFDKRIEQLFRTMVNYQAIDQSTISTLAKAKCHKLGLGYASTELGEAVDLAYRTAALCWKVHGDNLQRMLKQEINREIQA